MHLTAFRVPADTYVVGGEATLPLAILFTDGSDVNKNSGDKGTTIINTTNKYELDETRPLRLPKLDMNSEQDFVFAKLYLPNATMRITQFGCLSTYAGFFFVSTTKDADDEI
eukprot:gene254-11660_t